jgi:hypothetical protein
MTEDARARLLARLKARYRVGDSSRPPTPPPADLRERLAAAIERTLATEPERIVDLLHTRSDAGFGRRT